MVRRFLVILLAGLEDYEKTTTVKQESFLKWRMIVAPRKGGIARRLGVSFRKCVKELGALVSLEIEKIRVEGDGEVQEMIDICDFSVILSDNSTD
jgi:aldehyde dehydrogenase (NAD+)